MSAAKTPGYSDEQNGRPPDVVSATETADYNDELNRQPPAMTAELLLF